MQSDGHRPWLVGLVVALLLLGAWTAWFLLARVAVYEVSDQARLAASLEAHPIAAPVAGRIAAVRVTLGQLVGAGEVLIELEPGEQRFRLQEEQEQSAALLGQVAALRQQIAGERRALAAGRHAGSAAVDEARARYLEARVADDLAAEEAGRQAQLLEQGLVPEVEAARARSEAEQRRAAAEALRLTVARLEWDHRNAESGQQAEIEELERELALLEGRIGSAGGTVRRLERDLALRTVRATVAGRIGELAPVRAGSVVVEGEQLGSVVPEGEIKVIAEFSPASALGRIRSGQPARVRLAGFPSTLYGDLPATVARVASEPRHGRVRVELVAQRAPRSSLPFEHGLPGTVEVEVERVAPAALVLRTIGKLFARPAGGAEAGT